MDDQLEPIDPQEALDAELDEEVLKHDDDEDDDDDLEDQTEEEEEDDLDEDVE